MFRLFFNGTKKLIHVRFVIPFQITVTVPVTLFAAAPIHSFSVILSASTKDSSPDTIVPHSPVFIYKTQL